MGNANNKNKNPMTNVRTMGREGMKIMKDIAHGNYNIYNNGHIFRNLNFVQATIGEIDKRLIDLDIHIKAIRYAYANNIDPRVNDLLNRDQKAYDAYMIMREALCSILLSGGDTGFLLILPKKLAPYKYNI